MDDLGAGRIDGIDQWNSLKNDLPGERIELIYNINHWSCKKVKPRAAIR